MNQQNNDPQAYQQQASPFAGTTANNQYAPNATWAGQPWNYCPCCGKAMSGFWGATGGGLAQQMYGGGLAGLAATYYGSTLQGLTQAPTANAYPNGSASTK